MLSEKCYHCHGPDSGTRQPKKAPLRLDIEEFAFENRENGKPVIIKGKPADSYLVELIHSDDPEVVMPPPESHHSMSAREIALIEKWIEQGAEYQQHWSFIKPEKLPVPLQSAVIASECHFIVLLVNAAVTEAANVDAAL